jgi:hypothetical protein
VSRPLPDAAAAARGTLSDSDAPGFDRLAGALLASPSAPLGALLRAQLPGTAGVRWLRQEHLLPATRPTALSRAQWLSLHDCWRSVQRAPNGGGPGRQSTGRPSTHGFAGAKAVPRWGQ